MTRRSTRRGIAVLFAAALASCAAGAGAGTRSAAPAPGGSSSTVSPATAPVTTTTITIAPPTGPPPKYIWAYGDPLICGGPRPAEAQEAAAANHRAGALGLPRAALKERIVLLGDSTACSMWTGLAAVGRAAHLTTDQGVVFGCGIVSDQVTTTRHEAVGPHSERCHGLVDWAMRTAMARTRPSIVIWMSVWEKSDLVVHGRTLVANTPAWTKEIMARMDWELALFHATGARVVMITEPAPAPNPNRQKENIDIKADDASYGRLNALLRAFRARHPSEVTLVDLAAKMCPSGPPCPAQVAGLKARPDGRHFTPTAAVWASRWILKQIFPG